AFATARSARTSAARIARLHLIIPHPNAYFLMLLFSQLLNTMAMRSSLPDWWMRSQCTVPSHTDYPPFHRTLPSRFDACDPYAYQPSAIRPQTPTLGAWRM